MNTAVAPVEFRTSHARKPSYRVRYLVLGVALAVVLSLVYASRETYKHLTAEPNPVHDYRHEFLVAMMQETGVDPERAQEAWRTLADAIDTARALEREADAALAVAYAEGRAADRFARDGAYHQFITGLAGPRVHPALDRERALLERMREAGVFERIDAFIALGPAVDQEPVAGPLRDRSFPFHRQVREFSWTLLMAGRIALEAGDEAEFARCITRALALGNACANEAGLISRQTEYGVEWLTLEQIVHAVNESALSEETCETLLAAIDRFRPLPIALALRGEHAVMRDTIQYHFTDEGGGRGRFIPGQLSVLLEEDGVTVTWAEAFIERFFTGVRREEFAAEIDRCMTALQQEMQQPPSLRWTTFNPYSFARGVSTMGDLLFALMPQLRRALETELYRDVQREATRTALHLERFRARTGRDPESLADVEQSFGITLPVDPLHGLPFIYRRLDAPDAEGRMYLLYSTGFDQTDDGGVEDIGMQGRGRYAAIRDVTSTGVDFVITPRRWSWPAPLEGDE